MMQMDQEEKNMILNDIKRLQREEVEERLRATNNSRLVESNSSSSMLSYSTSNQQPDGLIVNDDDDEDDEKEEEGTSQQITDIERINNDSVIEANNSSTLDIDFGYCCDLSTATGQESASSNVGIAAATNNNTNNNNNNSNNNDNGGESSKSSSLSFDKKNYSIEIYEQRFLDTLKKLNKPDWLLNSSSSSNNSSRNPIANKSSSISMYQLASSSSTSAVATPLKSQQPINSSSNYANANSTTKYRYDRIRQRAQQQNAIGTHPNNKTQSAYRSSSGSSNYILYNRFNFNLNPKMDLNTSNELDYNSSITSITSFFF